jgi:aldose 1-epimerase
MIKKSLILASLAMLFASCANQDNGIILLEKSDFEEEINGKTNTLYTISNESGMTAQITNYGAMVVSLWVPAADGKFKDVIWGLSDIDSYLNAGDIYAGPIIGRYGNRIGKGRFSIDGTEYQLALNENGNQLHGGPNGFGSQVWDGREFIDEAGNQAVEMTYFSKDGEEGYPGNLTVKVIYSITEDNGFKIEYEAVTDKATIVNPTSHIYFNLHGTTAQSTDSHILTIDADYFTPTDAQLIPTGELASVEGTPMDFRKGAAIGDGMELYDYEAIKLGNGYDHNWVLNKKSEYGKAAEVYEASTGICMEIITDQPHLLSLSPEKVLRRITVSKVWERLRRLGTIAAASLYNL